MCECIETINGQIAEHNMRLVTNLIGPQKALVLVMKRDEKKRGKLPYLQASFCPFCGRCYGIDDVKPTKSAEQIHEQ
jgi:formate hydrogenlyase subunit 6/NADH:ubiquinone oxidoreductase subunit I